MDLRQLRIGNLVQGKGGKVFEVENLSEYGLNGNSWSDTHYGNQSGGFDWDYKDKDVFPVFLTKEWLLKFGFVKHDFDNSEYCFGLFVVGVKNDKLYLASNDGNFNSKVILYVHQLQNLYFALTGEELEIKK